MEEKKNNVFKNIWNYIIRTSGLMALGLFATLIVGTIIGQIGTSAYELYLRIVNSIMNDALCIVI